MMSNRNILSAGALVTGAAAFWVFLWNGDAKLGSALIAAAVGFLGAAGLVA